MEISKLLLTNYLPYCKATIEGRAIPSIDGLKPVQRRLLYIMNTMGLNSGNKVKSQKIVGQTMGIHPHGDASIYDTMVLMTTGYEGMNVPFVASKGSFGKKFSRDLKCAAPRYTEACLSPICKELFDGITENAVEFIDNYDGTLKEPTLLPVKFPSILVNSSAGVAVGTSSNIPSFSLKNVCSATIGILDGTITNDSELAKVLGAPEFTTGGFLHASDKALENLCKTGRGSFVISGKVEVYNNKIVITEIPYCTTAEDIMDAIDQAMKDKKIRSIKEVNDEIGLNGLRLVVEVKNGYKSREVLAELCRYTPLRTSVSFRTRVIVENRCKELSLRQVLDYWINFRRACLHRVYQRRLDKDTELSELLSAWEKIKHDIPGAVSMISKNTSEVAKNNLKSIYGLTDKEAEYLMDMKIRSITIDKAKASLDKLKELRENIKRYNSIVSNDSEKDKIIIEELKYIIDKYGKDNNTTLAPELTHEDTNKEIKISDELATVVLTREGYLKRLTNIKDIGQGFVSKSGDEEIKRWNIKNNEHLLVFDRFGTVHKILVDSIDSSSRGGLTDKLLDMAGIEKIEDIVWIDGCGDYTGYFNLIFDNGRGTRVYYDKAKGKRSQYKGLYPEVKPKKFWITLEDKFFMLTSRVKAAYCDLSMLGILSNRSAFKVARLSSGDRFIKVIPANSLENLALIDLKKYNKDYTVCIGDDIIYFDPKKMEEAKEAMAKEIEKDLDKYGNGEEGVSEEGVSEEGVSEEGVSEE